MSIINGKHDKTKKLDHRYLPTQNLKELNLMPKESPPPFLDLQKIKDQTTHNVWYTVEITHAGIDQTEIIKLELAKVVAKYSDICTMVTESGLYISRRYFEVYTWNRDKYEVEKCTD